MTLGGPISEDDLHAHVDGALDVRRRGEVEAFLSANPDVAERVRGFGDQRDALRDAFAPIAREPVPSELDLKRIAGTGARPRTAPRWRSIAAAVALSLAGAAAGWAGRSLTEPAPGELGGLAREASYSFATFASDRGRPVEIRADESAALVKWVSNRLKRPVSAPDLAASGFRFMGGRVVPTAEGPAGLFMYDDQTGRRLVMLMRPMSSIAERDVAELSSGAVAGLSWAKNGMGYGLAGEGAGRELRLIADAIKRQEL